MQSIKACVDHLAALGKSVDHVDVADHVLDGLDSDYALVAESVNARDKPISFEELHEKLINQELKIQQRRQNSSMPASAFALTTKPKPRYYASTNHSTSGNLSKSSYHLINPANLNHFLVSVNGLENTVML